jgi:hypothetical protein
LIFSINTLTFIWGEVCLLLIEAALCFTKMDSNYIVVIENTPLKDIRARKSDTLYPRDMSEAIRVGLKF